jgi:protease I
MKNKLLILVDELFEDLEYYYPKIRLEEEGYQVTVAGNEKITYHGKKGLSAEPNITINEINKDDYDGVVIPGGFAPDRLRRYPKILELLGSYDKEGKLIAFICHAGWVPISAGIMKGRKATSVSAIKDDMINAGTIWTDEPVVIDKNLISSRVPADLGAFCKAIINNLRGDL